MTINNLIHNTTRNESKYGKQQETTTEYNNNGALCTAPNIHFDNNFFLMMIQAEISDCPNLKIVPNIT